MSFGPGWFTSEDCQAQPSFSVATSNQLWKLSCPDSNLAVQDKPTSKTRVFRSNPTREFYARSNALNTRRPSTCYGATRAIPPTTIHQSQMHDPEIPLPNRSKTHLSQKKKTPDMLTPPIQRGLRSKKPLIIAPFNPQPSLRRFKIQHQILNRAHLDAPPAAELQTLIPPHHPAA